MFPFTLHQLQILKTVALKQSFTKAATDLYMSQPSLSRQILILERNLNIQLLKRQTSHVYLTKNGGLLLKYAERILALCEESCRMLKSKKNGQPDELTIGTDIPFIHYLLPRLLGLCNTQHSQLTLTLIIDSPAKIFTQILNHKLDIVLASEKICGFLKSETTLKAEYYITDPFHLILSNLHPFAKQTSIHKMDLYNLNYITLVSGPPCVDPLTILLNLHRIDMYKFKTVLQLNSLETIKTAVKLGVGVAFIPSMALKDEIELRLIKIVRVSHIGVQQKIFLINPLQDLNTQAFKIFYAALAKLKKSMLSQS